METDRFAAEVIATLNGERRGIGVLWESLKRDLEQLKAEEDAYQQDLQSYTQEKEALERDRQDFEHAVEREWSGGSSMEPSSRITLNIGGHIYQISCQYLKRDRFSLLELLSNHNNPIRADADKSYYFDRDWFLFRFIVAFLREGTLPDNRTTLRELYQEAEFFRLSALKTAIRAKLDYHRAAVQGGVLARGQTMSMVTQSASFAPRSFGPSVDPIQVPQQAAPRNPYVRGRTSDPLPDPFGFTFRRS